MRRLLLLVSLLLTLLMFSVTRVAATNLPPVITHPGDQFNYIFDTVRLRLQAYDPEGGKLTYTAVDLPPNLKINPLTGKIYGVIAPDRDSLRSSGRTREGSTVYDAIITITDEQNAKTSITIGWLIYFSVWIENFTLINTQTDQVVPDYESLYEGSIYVINLAEINATNVTLVAPVYYHNATPPGSVRFRVNGVDYRVENDEPYSLSGDRNGDYFRWDFQLNTWYTIRAIPHKHPNGQGITGYAGKIKIKIVNQP